jgi:hypothetical protein
MSQRSGDGLTPYLQPVGQGQAADRALSRLTASLYRPKVNLKWRRNVIAARLALAERRFSDCVAACRGVISIWEQFLGADRKKLTADVVSAQLGWGEDDLRRKLLDDLWKAANDLSNVPHHPEGQLSNPRRLVRMTPA